MHTKLTFEHPINPSLHIGDEVYFSDTSADQVTGSKPIHVGQVYGIFRDDNYIVINTAPTEPPMSLYVNVNLMPLVLFAKHIETNESSLKGYYANITFENLSNKKCELFGFGSETDLSSK